MHITTIGVDLAKRSFELAIADEQYRITERLRLSRRRFEQFIATRAESLFVLEACGSSQHWCRKLQAAGHRVMLLPAQYVKAYVRRNKTDAADAAALVEASRCSDLRPVPIKSLDQQQLIQLHRLREHSKRQRVAWINLLRGCLREYGITIPKGLSRGGAAMLDALQCADNGLPDALRPWLAEGLEAIATGRAKERQLQREIEQLAGEDELVGRWLDAPGVGLLGATAIRASAGDLQRFPSGRHFASWLGITAREHSSGERRRLGRISKQGDTYLRTLLIHGARSALLAAHRAQRAGKPLDHLRRWALQTEQRIGRNKATVALANKLARALWAMARYQRRFDGNWAAST